MTRQADTSDDDRRAGFLGFVAHEVRNPLSTALWCAELLARMGAQDRGGARGEKLSTMCLRAITRVRRLLEDHFLCERLDAGGIPVRMEAVAPRSILDAIVQRPGDHGEVTVDVDPALAVMGDRALLERALDGLLAVASADETPVRVTARPEPDRIAIVFSGAAPGSSVLQDPEKGAPPDPRGRALSLPVVRRIAAALGGELAAGDGGYVLSLPRSEGYSARPKPAAHP